MCVRAVSVETQRAMSTDVEVWPISIVDSLQVHRKLDPTAALARDASHFVKPLLVPGRGQKRKLTDSSGVVENEPGLCDQMEALYARIPASALALQDTGHDDEAPARVSVPPLATLGRSAHGHGRGFRFHIRACSCGDAPLAPPLLFSALVHNHRAQQAIVRALGARWILPRDSAFTLLPMARWAELGALRSAGAGYRLLLADPPWHSASVARAGSYVTCDKSELLAELVPAIRSLADPRGCVLAFWITNSRHVQTFVEERLFPQCGARPLARWYWLKLDSDGQWANGAEPRSPHRKPWEVVVFGFIGA